MISNPDNPNGPAYAGKLRRGGPARLDTANHFNVVAKDEEVLILRPKGGPMTKAEAANMAEWLFVHSGISAEEFARGVKEIKAHV